MNWFWKKRYKTIISNATTSNTLTISYPNRYGNFIAINRSGGINKMQYTYTRFTNVKVELKGSRIVLIGPGEVIKGILNSEIIDIIPEEVYSDINQYEAIQSTLTSELRMETFRDTITPTIKENIEKIDKANIKEDLSKIILGLNSKYTNE